MGTTSVSGFFSGARDFTINHGTFSEIHGDQIIYKYLLPGPIVNDDIPSLPRLENPSTLFTGRESYLKKMKEYFGPTTSDTPSATKSLLLHGMGGIGKTQICLKFIEECRDWFPHIFWINASSKSSITLALKQIAKVQGLTKSSALEWMSCQSSSNWLLIFDNADGGYEVVEEFLPSGKKGNILITSRNKALSRITSNAVLVDQMEEDEAILLLQKSGQLDSYSRDVAAHMVSMLGYVPVAIDQAGAYILECGIDLDEYLEEYATHHHTLMSNPNFKAASNYGDCAYGTWDLSIKKIEFRAASDQGAQSALLLHSIFGFLDCDNISQDMFKRAAEAYKKLDARVFIKQSDQLLLPSIPDPKLLFLNEKGSWDIHLFHDGIKVLLSFSLIKSNHKMYSVHPLVHAWSRDRLTEPDHSLYWKQARTVLTLSLLLPPLHDQADNEFCRTLLPHIRKIVQSIQSEYSSLEYGVYGNTFHIYGEWDDEIKLHQQVVQELLEMDSPEVLSSMMLLGNALVRNGMLKEGEDVQLQLQGMSDKFEIFNKLRPTIMHNLAHTYWLQGRLNEAEALVKEVLDKYPATITAKSVHQLALIYLSQGKLQGAEELCTSIVNNSEMQILTD